MSRPLTIIIKTTSECNMACCYCDADIYSHKRISFEILARVTRGALGTHGPVTFVWHGGEPLLMGKEFYLKALWLQQRYKSPGQRVTNSLQTNGTLLDEDWLDFFDQAGVSVSLSLDGPALLHNRNRLLTNKQGTFEKVMHAVGLMRKRNRGFGVLAVVTDDMIRLSARELFRFFVDNDLKSFALLCQHPAINVGRSVFVPRSKQSGFLREIFDLWLAEDDPQVCVRELDSIVRALLGGQRTSCLLAGDCIGTYFAIDPDGDVFHCDEFMFDPAYRLGNVRMDDFEGLRNGVTVRSLKSRNAEQIESLDCPWLAVCNGGCPKDRYVGERLNRDVHCCGFADLIEHIWSRIAVNVSTLRSPGPVPRRIDGAAS
jgi:uncharacterized protein